MLPTTVVHVKALLAVLTAALGTVAGGSMINSFYSDNGRNNRSSFIIQANPSLITIGQGFVANSTISVTSFNGYSGTVALSVYFPGGKLSTTFTPSTVTVPRNGLVKSILAITVPSATPVGNYTLLIVGSAQRGTGYAASPITVQVSSNQDFTITVNPSTVLNTQGLSNTVNAIVTSVNGFNGTVSLQATVPFGYITVTGGQNSLALSPGQTVTSTVTIATTTLTLPGTYLITVTGTSRGISHSTSISLTVTDPVITETLALASYSFDSPTNVTLFLRNTGTTTVTLQSYSISDASGDSWSFTWTNAPAIAPGATLGLHLAIGASCPTCTFSGITGLFMAFSAGQPYSVTVVTKAGHPFSFVVVNL